MIKVELKGKPENRAELRTALDIRCAEMGISRASYAVQKLQITPQTLLYMLKGVVSYRAHPEAANKICKITGADLSAWWN